MLFIMKDGPNGSNDPNVPYVPSVGTFVRITDGFSQVMPDSLAVQLGLYPTPPPANDHKLAWQSDGGEAVLNGQPNDAGYVVIGSAHSAGQQRTEVDYTFTSPHSSLLVGQMEVKVEGRASDGGVQLQLQLYKWSADAWITVYGPAFWSTTDTLVHVPSVANPGDYIKAVDKTVKVRVMNYIDASTPVFTTRHDQVRIGVTPRIG
jgi:hypothetical protein